jgi:hypothetical protein
MLPPSAILALFAALAIFVGLFTRTLEEFYKSIGTMLLKPIENYVKNKTKTGDSSTGPATNG